jgi:hypothetical protein
VWIKKARAALSHPAFTGISRNHLDRLVAELADPFAASASPAAANSYPTSSAPSPAWPATTPPPEETGPRATPIDPKVVRVSPAQQSFSGRKMRRKHPERC